MTHLQSPNIHSTAQKSLRTVYYGGVFILALSLWVWYQLANVCRSDIPASQERAGLAAGPFDREHVLEQSFVVTQDGLAGIQLAPAWGSQPFETNDHLIIRLFEDNSDQRQIAVDTVSLKSLQRDGVYQFHFPVQTNSQQTRYRLGIETTAAPGVIAFWSSRTDAIPGVLAVQGQLVEGDLVLRPCYRPQVIGLLRELLDGGLYFSIVSSVTLLCGLTGWGWLTLSGAWTKWSLVDRSVMAIGLGIITLPAILSCVGLFGIRPISAWLAGSVFFCQSSWGAHGTFGGAEKKEIISRILQA